MTEKDPYTKVVGAWDGLPFRVGPGQGYPALRNSDPAAKQPALVRDAKVRVFDLSNATDLQDYQRVWDDIAKGLAIFSAEDRQFLPDRKTWLIFLRWGVLAYEMPKGTVTNVGATQVYTGQPG